MLQQFKDENRRVLAGLETLEQRLPFRISVLARLLERQISRILARHDMTLAAYRVLVTAQSFGEITASELTRYTVVDRALISRKVADLSKAGLIDTLDDPLDTRRKRLQLTKAGKEKLASVKPDIDKRLTGLSEQFEPGEQEMLVRIIDKLTDHVARDLQESSLAN